MDEVSVVIRPFNAKMDEACIYSTWRNSSYYSGDWGENGRPYDKYYFKAQTITIKEILKNAKVRIACMSDDPMTIIGYSVYTDKHLDFVYVKDDYRNKGIGRMLVPLNIQTVNAQLTKIGKAIVEKKKLKIKENQNGNDDPQDPDPKAA